MTYLLDFSKPHFLESFHPATRSNLKLILWAGDGEHDGVNDVQRLPDYDVYLCLGIPGPFLDRNIASLSGSQTLCMINVNNAEQMAAFKSIFRGAFSVIDSDYYGNTPRLPLSCYASLLGSNGKAYNTEGMNSLVMPVENLLNTLEIFAPVLPLHMKEQRRWSSGILDLAKRDYIPASHVWSSPDLKHDFYNNARKMQEIFVTWQSARNPAWPACAETLEGHWHNLPGKTLFSKINGQGTTQDVVDITRPHLQTFCDYLSQNVDAVFLLKGKDATDYHAECARTKNVNDGILLRQKVLRWLTTEMPDELSCVIGYYRDTLNRNNQDVFGMYLVAV